MEALTCAVVFDKDTAQPRTKGACLQTARRHPRIVRVRVNVKKTGMVITRLSGLGSNAA